MKSSGDVRRWLESVPIERDGLSWMVSLAVHLTFLVLLALLWQTLPNRQSAAVLSALDAVPSQDALNLQDVVTSADDDSSDDIGANSVGGVGMALGVAPLLADMSSVDPQNLSTSEMTSSAELPVTNTLSTAPTLNDAIVVKGDAGVGAVGAAGAVHRITQEILQSLEQRPTLVVWLLDKSGSLSGQRATIERDFDHIYAELKVAQDQGAFAAHGKHPLLTAVMAFGQEIDFVTKEPTDDVAEIKQAIHGIPIDQSGIERTFTAVVEAVDRYKKYRTGNNRRNVMLVLVTDEAGNDERTAGEQALKFCKRQDMRVYVIGVPAPFGQREAYVNYVLDDTKYRPVDVAVDQGPESAMLENVQLGFVRGNDTHIAIDSGFGPYRLTRLCYETGGRFFAVHPNRPAGAGKVKDTAAMATRIGYFFDEMTMVPYRPNYGTEKEYLNLLKTNAARAALVTAAEKSRVDPMQNPRQRFPKRGEAELKQDFDVAQRDAAKVSPKLEELYKILADGEKDRATLDGVRWKAGYDLAMGRVLAALVRAETYNTVLGKAKSGMKFEKADSDTWVLDPSDEVIDNSKLKKRAAQAREYLTRVSEEHKGTPWAYLADKELADPLGWKWSEAHTGVNEPKRNPGGGGNGGNPKDALRKIEPPKPQPQNVKL